jgi:hypothetical protein
MRIFLDYDSNYLYIVLYKASLCRIIITLVFLKSENNFNLDKNPLG